MVNVVIGDVGNKSNLTDLFPYFLTGVKHFFRYYKQWGHILNNKYSLLHQYMVNGGRCETWGRP